MSAFWRGWFTLWCVSIGLFGAVLCGGAFEATSGPIRWLLANLKGPGEAAFDPTLRFALAVMGAVSVGWAVMLFLVVKVAIETGSEGRRLWNAITAGMIGWFMLDSALSVATGFGLNLVPNLALAGMYVIGLLGSGALKGSA